MVENVVVVDVDERNAVRPEALDALAAHVDKHVKVVVCAVCFKDKELDAVAVEAVSGALAADRKVGRVLLAAHAQVREDFFR